jgi:hypothetical protein
MKPSHRQQAEDALAAAFVEAPTGDDAQMYRDLSAAQVHATLSLSERVGELRAVLDQIVGILYKMHGRMGL